MLVARFCSISVRPQYAPVVQKERDVILLELQVKFSISNKTLVSTKWFPAFILCFILTNIFHSTLKK